MEQVEMINTKKRDDEYEIHIGRSFLIILLMIFIIFGIVFIFDFTKINTIPQRKSQLSTPSVVIPYIDPFKEVEIEAKSAIVYDVNKDKVLFDKNIHTQLPLASLTKVILAMIANDTLSEDAIIQIKQDAILREGNSGFVLGEKWKLQDLIDFTLMMSSNDGAQAIATAIKEKTGVNATDKMNDLMKKLGLNNTFFIDPTGLDESGNTAGAYGSANDMARIFAFAIRGYPNLIDATAKESALFESIDGNKHLAINTNRSVNNIPGIIAGKTGFTDLASGNLMVAFDASIGRPIVVVVLGSSIDGRFKDVEKLTNTSRVDLNN